MKVRILTKEKIRWAGLIAATYAGLQTAGAVGIQSRLAGHETNNRLALESSIAYIERERDPPILFSEFFRPGRELIYWAYRGFIDEQ